MDLLHHPVFQSLLLPLLVSVALYGLWRVAGPRWHMLTPALALLLTLAFWPGFDWPAASRTQILPWLALGAFLLAVPVWALRLPGSTPWAVGTGLWACALIVLAGAGLAAWGALGGSLMLAQLAAMLATVGGAAAGPAWRHRAISWAGLLPLIVFALGLALSLSGLLGMGSVKLLADDPYFTPQWD